MSPLKAALAGAAGSLAIWAVLIILDRRYVNKAHSAMAEA